MLATHENLVPCGGQFQPGQTKHAHGPNLACRLPVGVTLRDPQARGGDEREHRHHSSEEGDEGPDGGGQSQGRLCGAWSDV